jgi:hypothetical protein
VAASRRGALWSLKQGETVLAQGGLGCDPGKENLVPVDTLHKKPDSAHLTIGVTRGNKFNVCDDTVPPREGARCSVKGSLDASISADVPDGTLDSSLVAHLDVGPTRVIG